jgi:hypothetical protein
MVQPLKSIASVSLFCYCLGDGRHCCCQLRLLCDTAESLPPWPSSQAGEVSRFSPELLTSDSSPLLCNRPVGFVRLKQKLQGRRLSRWPYVQIRDLGASYRPPTWRGPTVNVQFRAEACGVQCMACTKAFELPSTSATGRPASALVAA